MLPEGRNLESDAAALGQSVHFIALLILQMPAVGTLQSREAIVFLCRFAHWHAEYCL